MARQRVLFDSRRFGITVTRLGHQLFENHGDFSQTCLVGIQPRGLFLAERIQRYLKSDLKLNVPFGKLDNTFYRDDFRTADKQLTPNHTEMDFTVEGKTVVLVDDVMYTGRTIRAAMDALLDFGRPKKVELLVLVERRFSRELPIQPDYVGVYVDSIAEEKVRVKWKEQDGEDLILIVPVKDE